MEKSAKLIKLDNGIRIILDPISHLKSASVGVWANVGNRHENSQNNGVAHLLEHLVFKGAGGRNANALAEDAEGRGIYLNAATSHERTGFFARCLSDEVGFALGLCTDLVLSPHLDARDFELEKNVVISEINEAFDDAEDRASVLCQLASYHAQPLGMPILGDAASLNNINKAQIERFHAMYSAPLNLIIGVSGAFDEAQILDLTARTFGALHPKPATAPINAQFTKNVLFEGRKIEQSQIALAFALPKPSRKEIFISQIFSSILSGGMASRLLSDLREKQGLVYNIDAYCENYFDVSRLNISFGCAANNAAKALNIIEHHLDDIAQNGPNEIELARAKKTLETSILLAFENPSSRLSSMVGQIFVFGETINIDEISQGIRNVTHKQIQELAVFTRDPSRRTASAIGNSKVEKLVSNWGNANLSL